jgi:putative phosphoesterase
MRALILADVHANWEALLTLQRAEPQPDAVLFAGDAVGFGPDPANCLRWLLVNTTVAVRGNHDQAVLEGAWTGFSHELEEAARETILYARQTLTAADVNSLKRWPLTGRAELGGARFYLVHGTSIDPLGGTLHPATCSDSELHTLFDSVRAEVIVVGHTHLPALRAFDGKLIVNPGSLGQPRYGVPDATYAVWEDGRIQIKHLHYDHEAVAQKVRLLPISPEAAEQLTGILETGLVEAP